MNCVKNPPAQILLTLSSSQKNLAPKARFFIKKKSHTRHKIQKYFYICYANNLNTNDLWHQHPKPDTQKTLLISRH